MPLRHNRRFPGILSPFSRRSPSQSSKHRRGRWGESPHCLQAGVFEARLSRGSQMKIDSGLKMEEFYNMRRILSRKREMKMNSIDPIISRSQASWSRTVRPPRFPPSCPPSPPPPPLRWQSITWEEALGTHLQGGINFKVIVAPSHHPCDIWLSNYTILNQQVSSNPSIWTISCLEQLDHLTPVDED